MDKKYRDRVPKGNEASPHLQIIKKHVQIKNRNRRKIPTFWSPDVDHDYKFIHLFFDWYTCFGLTCPVLGILHENSFILSLFGPPLHGILPCERRIPLCLFSSFRLLLQSLASTPLLKIVSPGLCSLCAACPECFLLVCT